MSGSVLPLIWSYPAFTLNHNISSTILIHISCFQLMTWRISPLSHISISNAPASYISSSFKIYPNSAEYRLHSPSTAVILIQTTTISQKPPNWLLYVSPHSQPSILNTDLPSLMYSSKTLVRSSPSPVKKHLTVTSHLRVKATVLIASVLPHCLSELVPSTCSPCTPSMLPSQGLAFALPSAWISPLLPSGLSVQTVIL